MTDGLSDGGAVMMGEGGGRGDSLNHHRHEHTIILVREKMMND